MPYFWMAAMVSPRREREGGGRGDRLGDLLRPSPNWSNSNTPTGPFPDHGTRLHDDVGELLGAPRPMSKIMSSSATWLAGFNTAGSLASNFLRPPRPPRSGWSAPPVIFCISALAVGRGRARRATCRPDGRPPPGRCWRCRHRPRAGRPSRRALRARQLGDTLDHRRWQPSAARDWRAPG